MELFIGMLLGGIIVFLVVKAFKRSAVDSPKYKNTEQAKKKTPEL